MNTMETRQPGGDNATLKLFEALYTDYIGRLGQTWDTMSKRIIEAQTKLGGASMCNGQSPEAAQKAYESAQGDYAEAVRSAWDDAQREYSAAYDQYVRGFRDAWMKTDLTDLSPMTMTMVTQSGSTAAGYAALTIGNVSLIAWAGVPPWMLSPDQSAQGASKQRRGPS
jgi:hypothetical protein